MKCNSDICIYFDPNSDHNCDVSDAVELDISGKCDCFVLADDAFIYEKEAERMWEKIQKRREKTIY